MKYWITSLLVGVCSGALAQAPEPTEKVPSEEDCLGLIAVLPTFHIKAMRAYYDKNPSATGKALAAKIQSLAEAGDKDAQFTYGMLLLNGYCVPRNGCAARRYLESSRDGVNNWEPIYPIPPWPKTTKDICN